MPTELASPSQPSARAAPPGPFLVIINPGSGEHDTAQTRELLANVFKEGARRFEFVPVDSPASLEAACRDAAARAAASAGVLVAVGGDGTINAAAQAAWSAACVLGVIPQGTFNYFGRRHGISQEAEVAARALLRGQVEPVQVGDLNGRLFLVNASLGLYPQLMEDREAFKRQLGRHRWVALLSGLITVFEWRRQLKLEIELDGERKLLTTPTVFVGNSSLQLERIGIDAGTIARVGEGQLAAIVTRPIGSWRMLALALRGALGRLGEAEQVQSFAFRTLTIRMKRRRRVKVGADGEIWEMTPPLRFAVAARPLQLLLPASEDRVPVE